MKSGWKKTEREQIALLVVLIPAGLAPGLKASMPLMEKLHVFVSANPEYLISSGYIKTTVDTGFFGSVSVKTSYSGSGVGAKISGGLDYFVTPKPAFTLEGGYRLSPLMELKLKGDTIPIINGVGDVTTLKTDYTGLIILGGIIIPALKCWVLM